jgi:hypothetical protein
MDRVQTEDAFCEAGRRAEKDAPDGFFERTGLDGTAFLKEVIRYCAGVDPAGTVGDIVVGFHLAKVLEERDD